MPPVHHALIGACTDIFNPTLIRINDGTLAGRHTIVSNGREAIENIYYVSFFKQLVDSNGHPAPPCQGAVEVRATNDNRAIELARQRFAELKNIADWSMRADYAMVVLLASRKRLSRRVRRGGTTKPLVAHREFV